MVCATPGRLVAHLGSVHLVCASCADWQDVPMGIRTTHVGSLPRPDSITGLLLAREHGERFDRDEFDAAMADAVDELVR